MATSFKKLFDKIFPRSEVMIAAIFDQTGGKDNVAVRRGDEMLKLSDSQMAEIFPKQKVMVAAVFDPSLPYVGSPRPSLLIQHSPSDYLRDHPII